MVFPRGGSFYSRFGIIEGNKDKCNLFTINIPSRRQAKPSPCFIAMFDGSSFKPKLVQNTGPEILSSMAVRLVKDEIL